MNYHKTQNAFAAGVVKGILNPLIDYPVDIKDVRITLDINKYWDVYMILETWEWDVLLKPSSSPMKG